MMVNFNLNGLSKGFAHEIGGSFGKIGGGEAKVLNHIGFPPTPLVPVKPLVLAENPGFLGASTPNKFSAPETPMIARREPTYSSTQEGRKVYQEAKMAAGKREQAFTENWLKNHKAGFDPQEIAQLRNGTPTDIKQALVQKGHPPDEKFEGWLQGEKNKAYNPSTIVTTGTPPAIELPPAVVAPASVASTPMLNESSLKLPNSKVEVAFSPNNFLPSATPKAGTVIAEAPQGSVLLPKNVVETPYSASNALPPSAGQKVGEIPSELKPTPASSATPDTEKPFWTTTKKWVAGGVGGTAVVGGGAMVAQNVGGG
jgi:hypothetical protein